MAFCQETTFKYSDTEFKVGATKLLEIYFEGMNLSRQEITRSNIDTLAQFLIKYPGLTVEISHHTSSRVSDDYNLTLSQKRAEAVKYYLEGKGIKPERIVAKGYGETMLLYSDEYISNLKTEEEKDECHHKNVRTVLKVLKID